MFQKSKIVEYSAAGKPEWGIHKRFMLFWYRPMTYMKRVVTNNTKLLTYSMPSREILTFKTREAVEDEIDRLGFGQMPIVSRIYQKGVMIKESYGKRGKACPSENF